MKNLKLITGTMLTMVMVLSITTAFAWYGPYYHPNGDLGDIHRTDTKKWGVEVGMTKLWAEQMADSCAMVDVYCKSNLQWHLDRSKFTGDFEDTRVKISRVQLTLAKRELDSAANYKRLMDASKKYLDKAKYSIQMLKAKTDAIFYLGRALHPVQDIYAHMDAGKDKTDAQIGMSHGLLNAPPVDVTIINTNGSTYVKKMKLEEKDSNGFLYSILDDAFYDYNGGWIYRIDGKKEDNKRWKDTKNATINIINEFLNYAKDKGITYK